MTAVLPATERSRIARPPVGLLLSTGAPKPERGPGRPIDYIRPKEGTLGQFAEEAARWVHVGDWIQAVHGDEGCWEQVVGTVRADQQTCITSTDGTRTQGRWWGHDDKVRVATAPVPDPEPYR